MSATAHSTRRARAGTRTHGRPRPAAPPPISAEALGEMTDADLRCIQRYGETTAVRYAATLVLIGRATTNLAVLS